MNELINTTIKVYQYSDQRLI